MPSSNNGKNTKNTGTETIKSTETGAISSTRTEAADSTETKAINSTPSEAMHLYAQERDQYRAFLVGASAGTSSEKEKEDKTMQAAWNVLSGDKIHVEGKPKI
ncbi:hypothetical protein MMC21_006319 [Puttea exsequens]|nr:hypothetical protein [Puttea exsequens]